jgi:excisionase family DNA binding protein
MTDPVNRIADALERIAAAMEVEAQAAGTPLPEALSKEDAARFLGVDVPTIEQLIRTRRLAYVQHGSQRGRVITVAALREFLDAHRQATGEELAAARKRA